MDCKDVKNLVSLYVDGELDPKEDLEMVEHLSKCESCYFSVRSERFVKRVLKSSFTFREPPLSLVSEVKELYEEKVRILPVLLRFAPALLLLFFLVLALIFKMNEQRLDNKIFRNISNPPLTASIEDVNKFFSSFGFVKKSLKLNENNRSGMNFIGMRINRFDDRDAAYIYYRHKGKNISFFAIKGSISDKMRFIPASYYKNNSYIVRKDGQNLLLVSENDITYALAGEAEADELYEIFSDLR